MPLLGLIARVVSFSLMLQTDGERSLGPDLRPKVYISPVRM